MNAVPTPYERLPQVPTLSVTSADFADGSPLGRPQWSGIFGAGGEDVSPQLSWNEGPVGCRSYAVTCFDPDAPVVSGFWHWAVAGIPNEVTSLPPGAGTPSAAGTQGLPEQAVTLVNDGGIRGFLGAAPPPGHGRHRYVFAVHALDAADLQVAPDTSPAFLGFQLATHTVARGLLTGYHEQ